MKSGKMAKKANALKGFLNSMTKKKGEMGMGTPPASSKITSAQSKSLNIPKGTPYKTTATPSDKVNTVRSSFNSPPRNSAEINAYMQSKNKPAMKPSMKKGGETSFGMLSVKAGYDNNPNITAADRISGAKKKGQKGMNVMSEAKKNATPSIPNSYYAMGGMKEMNPLASMIKKKSTKKAGMKPKMQMGGSFFPQNPLTASKYQKDTLMGQSFKKGGKVKKK